MKTDLSPREAEILGLVVHGLTNDEIAARLGISRRTVETHLRAVFHKTGVTRRGQLVALSQHSSSRTEPSTTQPAGTPDDWAVPVPQRDIDPAAARHRLQLYAAAVRGLVDRQFPLFEERVEITLTVGEHDGLDTVVERRWTTPKPYLVYRILSPIVAWTGPPTDPDELALNCSVHGPDIQADLNSIQDTGGRPFVLVLFQPGLQTTTEWTLRYRSPTLWNPLRKSGHDNLTWATTTLDQRHRPTINDLTLKVVFPATWADGKLMERDNLGEIDTERLPTGQNRLIWHARTPVAAAYHWVLQGRPRPETGD